MYNSFKILLLSFVFVITNLSAQQQFELVNNFIFSISFITGENEGTEQNLDDNFQWMQEQGYTHLRFFGIFPNGHHTFPSPTLDANGYPTDPALETVLGIIVTKANQYGVTVNFDGWEVIAESNRDTTLLGVGYITEDEISEIVKEVLSLGITLISEEQFGKSYLHAIQSTISQMGATHETTAGYWWPDSTIADAQLASVFSFYHYNQSELDSLINLGSYPPSNLGNLHISAEGVKYFDIPFSIAVGSFGSLNTEHWKNVLLFAQLQYLPKRFSIEEENTNFTIWNTNFNFMDYVGSEILSFAEFSFGERPIVNLIIDPSEIPGQSFIPALYASIVNNPAIVNSFTSLGYRVIVTVDSVLPEADIYYLMLAGGSNQNDVTPLPEYVLSLLNGNKSVFIQPVLGIPDENDATDWTPVRDHFGLPSGDTETLLNSIPAKVTFDNSFVNWGGVNLYIIPRIEKIISTEIDTNIASVVLSGEVDQQKVALIIKNDNKFLINSGVIHLEASFVLSGLLDGPINIPATADIVLTDDKALIFAEYDVEIDLDIPWNGITKAIRFDPQGNRILETNIDLGGNYSNSLQRGELIFLRDLSPTVIDNDNLTGNEQPESFTLSQNFPNPFNPSTTIKFSIPSESFVTLKIYDVLGNAIEKLVNEQLPAGNYKIEFSAGDLASGIYFYKIQTGEYVEIKKMILLR